MRQEEQNCFDVLGADWNELDEHACRYLCPKVIEKCGQPPKEPGVAAHMYPVPPTTHAWSMVHDDGLGRWVEGVTLGTIVLSRLRKKSTEAEPK